MATLLQIETRLFDRLRGRPYYPRLKGVVIEPSKFLPSGWTATIVGEFTVAEHADTAGIIRELQNSLPLTDPDGDGCDSGEQRARRTSNALRADTQLK